MSWQSPPLDPSAHRASPTGKILVGIRRPGSTLEELNGAAVQAHCSQAEIEEDSDLVTKNEEELGCGHTKGEYGQRQHKTCRRGVCKLVAYAPPRTTRHHEACNECASSREAESIPRPSTSTFKRNRHANTRTSRPALVDSQPP